MKTEKLFIGEVNQVIKIEDIPGVGDTLLEQFYTAKTKYTYYNVKKTLLKKKCNCKYKDLVTNKKYKTTMYQVGDIFVNENSLIPFMLYQTENERDKKIAKKKARKTFKSLQK